MSYEINYAGFADYGARLWRVPHFDPRPAAAQPPANSPQANPFRFSLKLLGAYAVAIVNGVALLYILAKIFSGLRQLFEGT